MALILILGGRAEKDSQGIESKLRSGGNLGVDRHGGWGSRRGRREQYVQKQGVGTWCL